MSSLLIQGGRVVSPSDSLEGEFDVLIENGVVREIAPKLDARADEVLDARGRIVSPGFVDIHVHFREPGGEQSETIETGLAVAVAGGFTTVCPMPNTRPVNDNAEITRFMAEKAERLGLARLLPIAAVSTGSEGRSLTDFPSLIGAGAVAFSDDGRPVRTAGLMRQAMEQARPLNVPIADHCEDPGLSAGGVVNAGPVAARLGVKGIPNASEEACVERDLEIAEATGGALHVAHVSTAGAVAMIREAKRRGVRVTCEATPHHFALTEEAVERYGTAAKMNPPLRSATDREAVLAALADGTIDAIATDHAPHAPGLKAKPMGEAPFGVIGLETALALALRELVHSRRIPLARMIELMSSNPARIINRPFGHVRIGSPADATIFSPDLEWTYSAERGRSRSRNSPFDGWRFRGAVTATIARGRIVYKRDKPEARSG
jgi:dihydroorotase